MATTFDDIMATTMQEYAPTLENQCFENQPFLNWLMSNGNVRDYTGGRSIVCPLIYAENSTCTSYSNYDTIPVTPQKGIGAAEFMLKQAACSISLCGFEECVNQGANEVIDLVDAKMMQAQRTLEAHFNRQFILSDGTGNNGKDMNGLANLIGDEYRSPQVGNIDGSDPACDFWRSQIFDCGLNEAIANGTEKPEGKALTLDWMDEVFMCISDGADRPDLILTDKKTFRFYKSLLAPNQMFTNTMSADAGFTSITFNGISMIWDDNVPEGTMYFLNSRYIQLRRKVGRWFTVTPFIRPVNQDARYAQILMFGQLVIKNRKRQGAICNIKCPPSNG